MSLSTAGAIILAMETAAAPGSREDVLWRTSAMLETGFNRRGEEAPPMTLDEIVSALSAVEVPFADGTVAMYAVSQAAAARMMRHRQGAPAGAGQGKPVDGGADPAVPD